MATTHVSPQFLNALSTYCPIDLRFDLDDALANFSDHSVAGGGGGDPTASPVSLDACAAASVSLVSDMPTVKTVADVVCTVCMERFRSGEAGKRIPCGHVYHASCIGSWLSVCDSCPLCRRKIAVTGDSI